MRLGVKRAALPFCECQLAKLLSVAICGIELLRGQGSPAEPGNRLDHFRRDAFRRPEFRDEVFARLVIVLRYCAANIADDILRGESRGCDEGNKREAAVHRSHCNNGGLLTTLK